MTAVHATHYSMLIVWSDDDHAFVASFPEWEAVGLVGHAHGNTYADAVRNGEEMLRVLVESARSEGDAIPEPHRFAATM